MDLDIETRVQLLTEAVKTARRQPDQVSTRREFEQTILYRKTHRFAMVELDREGAIQLFMKDRQRDQDPSSEVIARGSEKEAIDRAIRFIEQE